MSTFRIVLLESRWSGRAKSTAGAVMLGAPTVPSASFNVSSISAVGATRRSRSFGSARVGAGGVLQPHSTPDAAEQLLPLAQWPTS
jgi:hypothetical protein